MDVFISYSPRDVDYARMFATELERRGFDVRIDDGNRWSRKTARAIRECAAFSVIMTPAAEESKKVRKAIRIAEKHNKPIFPLLLEGDEFDMAFDIQYTDVTDGELPPDDFFARLHQVALPRLAIEAEIAAHLAQQINDFSQSVKMFGPSWAIGIVRVWTQNIPGKGRQMIACILHDDMSADEIEHMLRDGWANFSQQVVKEWPLADDPDLPAQIADVLIAVNEHLGITREDIQIERR